MGFQCNAMIVSASKSARCRSLVLLMLVACLLGKTHASQLSRKERRIRIATVVAEKVVKRQQSRRNSSGPISYPEVKQYLRDHRDLASDEVEEVTRRLRLKLSANLRRRSVAPHSNSP